MARLVTWDEIWLVKRDICFLYHELAEFPTIDADRAFSLLYTLPYWEYLLCELPASEETFIQRGCLVMIFTMALDTIQGSGCSLEDKLQQCRSALPLFVTENAVNRKLADIVVAALEVAAQGRLDPDAFELEAQWVNQTCVYGYFHQMESELRVLHQRVSSANRRRKGQFGHSLE